MLSHLPAPDNNLSTGQCCGLSKGKNLRRFESGPIAERRMGIQVAEGKLITMTFLARTVKKICTGRCSWVIGTVGRRFESGLANRKGGR